MLLPLAIFLVLFPQTLSSTNSVGSVLEYPRVAPSVSHGRRSGVMQEKQCFVARFCEYRICEDNFSCKVSKYVISKAGFERTLPKWLWFDERNKTLKGVASPADEGLSEILIIGLSGQQDGPVGHICGLLTVKFVVWSLKHFPLFAQNFPTNPVINDNFFKTSAWTSISCQFNEPIVLATLVFAGNFHEMDGNEKINVLDVLLQSYHISMYDVFILSSGEEDSLSDLLQTSHVLASGPGSNRSATGPSTTITWHVRCGIIHLDDSLFRAMEKLSQHSALINNVSYAPTGWHVVTGFQKHHVRRKRDIGGTTTPAYSTIPISRATVITTKIKIRRTTFASLTATFTWSRPLPTFSSPFIFSNTSLYIQSATLGSRFSNNDTSVSLTSPVMPQSRSMSSISQISPSKRQTTAILQYKSVNSTFPMMSQLNKISSTSQDLPSIQEVSKVTHSTSIYSQIQSTSGITRVDNLSITSRLPSLKFSTFVGVSSTTSENQRSTLIMISLSSRSITSSLPQTRQAVTSSTSLSPSDVSSKIISNFLTTENHLISTSKISSVRSATAMATAQQTNSTVSTTSLQPSYSTFIGTVNVLSSGTYSPVLLVTTNPIIKENISTTVDHLPRESSSSIAHTKSMLSITASPSSGSSVQLIKPTATTFLPGRNSSEILTSSKNTNITPTIIDEQASTTRYISLSLASERILYSSHSTLVLKRASITPQTSLVDKNPKSTSLTITSGIGIQSYGYNTSKVINMSTSNSTMHSSRLGNRSKETFQTSSTGAISSQLKSSLFQETKLPPTSVVNLISTATVKTPLPIPSQYISRRSFIFSTIISSTATIHTLTERLRSAYSSLINTSPASTYTSSVQTITVQSGSLISNVEPNPSTSSLFTPQISAVFSTSSSIARFDVGHSSLSVSSTLAGSIDQSYFHSKTSRTLSPYIIMSISSHRGSLYRSSSNEVVKKLSTSPVATSTSSSSDLLSSSFNSSILFLVTNTASSDYLLSYYPALSTSPSIIITTTPSSILLPSYSYHWPTSLSTVVTTIPSSVFPPLYHTPNSISSDVTTTPSSVFLLSYHTSTSPSTVVTTTTLLSVLLPSYPTLTSPSTVVTTTPSSVFLSSYHTLTSPSTIVITTSSSVLLLSSTPTSSPTFVTTNPSSVFLSSYHTPTSSPTVVTTTPSSVLLPSYHTLTLPSTVVITTSSSVLLLSSTPTSSPTVVTTTPSSVLLPSYHTPTLPSTVIITTSSSVLLHHFLSSHHSSSTNLTTTSSVVLVPSYYTLTESTIVATTPSSVFFSSYHTPTSPLTVVTITSSSDSLFSSLFSTASLPASYKTFSLSFLSSSIVSSQPSISTDISMMVHPTIESTISYTLTKLSLPSVSWPLQPSYRSRQSSRTTATLLTRTSMKMPVITSSEALLSSSTSSESRSTAVTLPTTPSQESPKIYNNFDLFRVTVGKVFEMQIPVDTFHDREDGNTRNLRLELLTVTHARISSDSWLQFNSTTQTLYGLVLKSQLEVIGSSTEYLLTASDHDGNTVHNAFIVEIEDNAKPLAAKFAVKLAGTNLEIFTRDLSNILSIVQTIAGYYGDKHESLIQVLSLTEGSVIFTWSNTSLQTCDEDLINDLARKIKTRRGEIQPYFYNALSPRFIADEVSVNYTGACILHTTETPSVSGLSSHDTSQWLKYVLPALAVVVIIVVTAVACLLVRRHSGVKVLKEDRQIFKRRKPIILDGEREMSAITGKPIELPEDSLTPVRFVQETSCGTPDYYEDDTPEFPSPILPAPSYQRLPPRYSDERSNRYNTPPPPYKLPPSY